ncbi:MAG: phosphodiester glycosidase family protein [Actinobacteria bacterium]|nr:MAG: phosphodiester glycosidase family protein [Actinomycetota bacterium]
MRTDLLSRRLLKRILIAAIAAFGIAACSGTRHVSSTQTTKTSGRAAIARAHPSAVPLPIRPVFPNPLPGEGVWKPTGPPVNGGPPVLVTTYRPELGSPDTTAYVAWFDHTRTELAYYPGGSEPPSAAVRGPTMVPQSQRYRLLATFNAGFTYTSGNNGSTDNGQVNEPLSDGNATLIGYSDGRVDIVKWSGGPNAGLDVAWTRQSLPAIVWNGQLNPDLNDSPDSVWGATLGGVCCVPRTGVGIDRHGNLFFVVATNQTVITLAKILKHIGAVRAMEFDINYEWHSLISYSHGPSGLVPKLIEPQNQQTPTRYLVPDSRDFFAAYTRLPGPVTVPFK